MGIRKNVIKIINLGIIAIYPNLLSIVSILLVVKIIIAIIIEGI
jgi:hypothetical protein